MVITYERCVKNCGFDLVVEDYREMQEAERLVGLGSHHCPEGSPFLAGLHLVVNLGSPRSFILRWLAYRTGLLLAAVSDMS